MTGAGTRADPFILSTDSDLLEIKNDPTAYYLLEKDIDMKGWGSGQGWLPIQGFRGTLDGQGHALHNLFINRPTISEVGFFAQCNGTIRNLIFTNARVVGKSSVGILAGKHTINTLTISKVKVEGKIVIGGDCAGGLVGSSDNYPNIITDCDVTIEITPTVNISSAGGLMGLNANNEGSTFSKCKCDATIGVSNFDFSVSHVGGILGKGAGAFEKCDTIVNLYGGERVGGIVGHFDSAPTDPEKGRIKDCTSKGNITCTAQYVGGIVGVGSYRMLHRCSSACIIKSENGQGYYGGIVGWWGGCDATRYIANNEFHGKINMPKGGNIVGGILGYHDPANIKLIGCILYGEISAASSDYVAGIVAQSHAGEVLYNANFGKVTGKSTVGGIVGQNRGTTWENIYYNLNMGPVIGSVNVGSIVGTTYYSRVSGNLTAQRESQERAAAVAGTTSSGASYTNNYQINRNGAQAFKSGQAANVAVTEANMLKQASYGLLNFETQWCIIEGEEIPRPRNCGRYPGFDMEWLYPVSIINEVEIGGPVDIELRIDWGSAAAFGTRLFVTDGTTSFEVPHRIENNIVHTAIPITAEESELAKFTFIFWTSDSMYFVAESSKFKTVESEETGLVLTDENMNPYNTARGTIIRNIRIPNLALGTLSAAKKVFVYNKSDATIERTTVKAMNDASDLLDVLMGTTVEAFEGDTTLEFANMGPKEKRPFFIKVQTADKPEAALIPIKLYAEQTVVA